MTSARHKVTCWENSGQIARREHRSVGRLSVEKGAKSSRKALPLPNIPYESNFVGSTMRNGILRTLFMLAGGLLLISFIAMAAALLAARMGISNLGTSLAPPVAMAANISHRSAAFERRISTGGSWDIFLVDGRTGQVRQITTHPAMDRFPVLSPDGKSVAFVSWRDGNSEVYVIDVEDGALRNISNHPAYDTLPVWSPDSSMLVFVSDRDGNSEIYLADIYRGLIQNLTHMASHDSNPQWTTDGAWIMFSAYGTLGWDEFQISIDGHRSLVMASHPYPLELNR